MALNKKRAKETDMGGCRSTRPRLWTLEEKDLWMLDRKARRFRPLQSRASTSLPRPR
jgi:hypothetical protein